MNNVSSRLSRFCQRASHSHRATAAQLLVVGLALVACAKSTDPTPEIQVTPGAAKRIGLIASRNSQAAPVAAAARVHPLVAGAELGGPNATGKPGDWMLENDEVVFVIDALGGGAGFAESGGNLIDAADAHGRRDELGQLFTYFGAFPRQAVYTQIDAHVDPDGTAVVVCTGVEIRDASLAVVTEWRLAPGDRALLIRTTVTNKGTAAATIGLGDVINWGGTEKVAPGKPAGFRGPSQGPYIGGVGRSTSYALTSTDGDIAATSGGAWTDTEQKKNVTIPPGGSEKYARVFVVGERPDSASLVAELTKSAAGDVGAVEIQLVDAAGKPTRASAGSKVVVGTEAAPDLLTFVAAEDGPVFGGELPPGTWKLHFAPSAGRREAGDPVSVTVVKGKTATAKLAVSEPGSVKLGPCTEAGRNIPCKLTINGLAGTPDPSLGPAFVAGLARNVVYLGAGLGASVPLPFGHYHVTASRGPEYDFATTDITVPGNGQSFALKRAVNTKGWVATDFHQHSVLSADSAVATRDRVLANAAEGVEVAVASEHNVVADLEGLVKELKLETFMVELTGVELSSDSSKVPFGHANVFPIVSQPDKPRNGAPVIRDRLASEAFADARAMTSPAGKPLLQINHPRSGANGYFDCLGFDPKTGVGTKPGYVADFDSIEVWNGRDVGHRATALEDYLALVRTGHAVTPIADTDTHGIVGEEPGYPRTYVHVQNDGAFDQWDAGRAKDLASSVRDARDVLLTNGPFMTVTGAGSVVPGTTTLKVHVETPPWMDVQQLEVRFVKSKDVKKIPLKLQPRGDGKAADVTIPIAVKEDDAAYVIASGGPPMRPLLNGRDADIEPWAMASPIWLDADGDGKSLGRIARAPR